MNKIQNRAIFNHLTMQDRKSWCFVLPWVSLLVFAASGCTPQAEPAFYLTKTTLDLPESHQKQIQDGLEKYFGTPSHPLLKVPTEETDDDGNTIYQNAVDPEQLAYGAEVFVRRCAGCHGVTGDGVGDAADYLQPKPRDYRPGVFKFTSTPYGSKPVRNDLIRIILNGAKGTSMPSFKFLPEEELQAVVNFVITIAHRGEVEKTMAVIADEEYEAEDEIPDEDFARAITRVHEKWTDAQYEQVRPLTPQPKMTDETILAGRKAFLSRACSQCHGTEAKGQTAWLSAKYIEEQLAKPEDEREKINYDAWEHVAPAADLTAGMLHGGRRPIDIYRRIYSGINGTPMPGFSAAFAEEPDTIWHLVHYVLSVVDRKKVEGLEDIKPDPKPGEEAPAAETPAEPTEEKSAESTEEKPAEPSEDKPAESTPESKPDATEEGDKPATEEPAAETEQADADKPETPAAEEPQPEPSPTESPE